MSYESLHNHTNISDGQQSHLEVLATAEENGFGIIAFTDHDILPDEKKLKELKTYRGPVKWLIGCEITSGLPKELGGGATGTFHILGLFVDPFNVKLKEHSKLALKARKERMENIVNNLQGLGFIITADDCLEASQGESVGRPHIVKALLKNDKNIELIEKLRMDMKKASQTDGVLKEKYDVMMESASKIGISQYPYDIFLKEDSFIKNIYVGYLYSIDMDNCVKLIRDAGGIAILAHWWTVKNKIDITMLEQFLKEGRLDGIEIAMNFISNDDTRQLLDIAEKTGVLQTFGIDAHRRKDFENFTKNKDLAVRTEGTTRRLIDKAKPLLKWSNLT